MTKYAYFNHGSPDPHPVLGWLDTDIATSAPLPDAVNLLALTEDQWTAHAKGWWAVSAGVLVAAAGPVFLAAVPAMTIPALVYLNRFTPSETTAIHLAALASPPTTASLAIFNYLLQVSASPSVTLDNPQVVGGHQFLVQTGLLTADRSTAILTPRTDGT